MKAITIMQTKTGFIAIAVPTKASITVNPDEVRAFGELGDTGYSDRHLTNFLREWAKTETEE
jgi:hypothetical protein